ncbi:MAG: hypothetical protein SPH62_06305, partial [Candidatus Egerieousia sp.]|nr:hypothetical protein [bacterium]MDY5255993.1 hypothetical protein [Candidatus Egerieousia sp.]
MKRRVLNTVIIPLCTLLLTAAVILTAGNQLCAQSPAQAQAQADQQTVLQTNQQGVQQADQQVDQQASKQADQCGARQADPQGEQQAIQQAEPQAAKQAQQQASKQAQQQAKPQAQKRMKPQPQEPKHAPQQGNDDKKTRRWNEIMSQKVAFVTQQLQLTPEEAEKFWPVYNAASEEVWKASKKTLRAIAALVNSTKDDATQSEEEIKKLVANLDNCKMNEIKTFNKLFTEISKVLPLKKAAKIYGIEEQFRQHLIKNLSKRAPGQKPKEASKPGP